ncbi:MAG: hypothetical protein V5A84_04770 [Planctomycetota bacterium]
MSSEELPDFYEKREILFGDSTTEEEMRSTGEQFMRAGRYDDALEFFARCDADDLVREIIEDVKERGDTPVFLRAKRVLDEETSEEEWDELAQNALEHGSPSKAYVAKVKAGKEDEAEQLKERIYPDEVLEKQEITDEEQEEEDDEAEQ